MGSSRTNLTRATARRLTLAAQGAAALLALGTAGIFAFGVPERPTPAGPPVQPPAFVLPDPGDQPSIIPTAAHVDFAAIVERMALVDNAPKATSPPEPEPGQGEGEGEGGGEAEPNDPKLAARVRFLGVVTSGTSRLALLSVDGRQSIVGPGEVVRHSGAGGLEPIAVSRVDDDRVHVRGGGDAAWIDLAAPVAAGAMTAAVPESTPEPVSPAQGLAEGRVRPGRAGRTGILGGAERDGTAMDPLQRRLDAIDRLVEQGRMDQDRADQLRRQAMEQLQRPGQGDDEQR